MARRTYTEEEKAAALVALDAAGGNLEQTARRAGVPRNTLRRWKDGQGVNAAVTEQREELRQTLADRLEGIADDLVALAPQRYEQANLLQVMTALGIAIDKSHLLRGKATSIVQGTHTLDFSALSLEELDTLERLLDRAEHAGADSGGAG